METFKCAKCLQVFEKAWTDAEAQAERDKHFPNMKDEQMVQVCDSCWRTIMMVN